MRRRRTTKRELIPDVKYNSELVARLINTLMKCGKKSMEQFEIRTHKRLMDIIDPTAKTVDELKKLSLPAGVDISIKIGG